MFNNHSINFIQKFPEGGTHDAFIEIPRKGIMYFPEGDTASWSWPRTNIMTVNLQLKTHVRFLLHV